MIILRLQGTTILCYINVLSWDKVEMPCIFTNQVPLFGGMRMSPPRTSTEAVVFAVLANPEYLRVNGKNAQDPQVRMEINLCHWFSLHKDPLFSFQKQSKLIELLLDFVEAMNTEIVFNRSYTILKDCDITGELKEVWNAVQTREALSSSVQQETWIDVQPPMLQQYSQYQDQQQEYAPPQYPPNFPYVRPPLMCGPQPPSQTPLITINDQIYAMPQPMYEPNQQRYRNNIPPHSPRMPQPERYSGRGRGRGMMIPNIPQSNCPTYRGPQFQFQQLPTQMMPQYINTNVHPNMNVNMAIPPPTMTDQQQFTSYVAYNQVFETMTTDSGYRRRHQRPPPPPHLHLQNHMAPFEPPIPVPYNPNHPSPQNMIRPGKPHMGVTQKNNLGKRHMNSPTRSKQTTNSYFHKDINGSNNYDNGTKPKSPVKVLQRVPGNDCQDSNGSITTSEPKNLTDTNPLGIIKRYDDNVKTNDKEQITIDQETYPNNSSNFEKQPLDPSSTINRNGNKTKSHPINEGSYKARSLTNKKLVGYRPTSTNNKLIIAQETNNEVPQNYTIYKKTDTPDLKREDLTNGIFRMSIQDCKEQTTTTASEVVIS